jgi:hypothetical protein
MLDLIQQHGREHDFGGALRRIRYALEYGNGRSERGPPYCRSTGALACMHTVVISNFELPHNSESVLER